jgi:serine protease Do
VTTVEPDGPAESAGFKPYDVIREFDGKPVRDARQLRLHVANKAPGEAVKVAVLRDGREQTLEITLGELPGSEEPARRSGHSESGALSGLSVEELTPAVAQRLGLPPNVDGVVVARVASGSPAADAGVQPGDVIEQVNRKPITSVSEFRAAVREAGDGALLMMVTNRRGSFLVTVEP